MKPGLITVIVPVYNVAQYLNDFLASLETQTVPLDRLDLVFVDDGSTDSSRSVVEEWVSTFAPHAKVIHKSNGGLSSARNEGLKHAHGKWVTFCDPDDVLSKNYFATVSQFLSSKACRKVHLAATHVKFLHDATGEVSDTHPLRFKFAKGDVTIDLDRHPNYIHLSAASGFYRRATIETLELTFDGDIRPNFEDGHFTSLYLAAQSRPRVRYIAGTSYLYRRRQDRSSLVQSSWKKPEKYRDLPKYGYLGLLQRIHERLGFVPLWVQNVVLYDLFFYFRQDDSTHSHSAFMTPEMGSEFQRLVRRIVEFIDSESILGFTVIKTPLHLRHALLLGAKLEESRPSEIAASRIDSCQRLVQLKYYYSGKRPIEEFRSRGYAIEPVHAKWRHIDYLGATWLWERIVWLPATGTLSVSLDGRRIPLHVGPIRDHRFSLTPRTIWGELGKSQVPVDAYALPNIRAESLNSKLFGLRRSLKVKPRVGGRRSWSRSWAKVVRLAARHGRIAAKYRRAWVFIDRDVQAHDNAEHLYRYVKANHAEVNAWFVLSRKSSDWARLESEGFRLVDHGSLKHVLLMLNCDQLISSQADYYITHPLDTSTFGPNAWSFTFLQHGVIKDDLSRWLNNKPIELFVTSGVDEYRSIAGDGSGYSFTSKEVRLTGLPRHDRLGRLARETYHEDREFLLVMPTWRRWLLGDNAGGNLRPLADGFWESEYAANWLALLDSPELRALSERAGLRILFVPHPNLQPHVQREHLPRHVELGSYSEQDIQRMLVGGALMITDYSSLAFDMAYIERPVVYFQFDEAEFFAGAHVFRRGYWDYRKDGFGPVATSVPEVVRFTEEIVSSGCSVADDYRSRMKAAYEYRDGSASRRVYDAIRDIRRPLTYQELYRRVRQDGSQVQTDTSRVPWVRADH